MSRNVVWLFGRGVSASCGLAWDVPERLYQAFRSGEIGREELTRRIREQLSRAQAEALRAGRLELAPLEALLERLQGANRPGWKHAFVTTNWDTLLERVLDARVWHLNGSIDGDGALLTEADTREEHDAALGSSQGFRQLLEAEVCVVAGVSLRSALDKQLVARLGSGQKWAPAGEHWIVVNHDAGEIAHVSRLLEAQLEHSRIAAVKTPFEGWVRAGMPELRELGVLR
jgi:hypothetical protein